MYIDSLRCHFRRDVDFTPDDQQLRRPGPFAHWTAGFSRWEPLSRVSANGRSRIRRERCASSVVALGFGRFCHDQHGGVALHYHHVLRFRP